MCIDREPTWGTEVYHTGLCQFLETRFSKRAAEGEILVRQDDLLVLDCSIIDFLGLQFTTCDYIKGTKGHYMPKENFLYLRKSEHMIAKITFPTPIHLLYHIIIPIHIRKSHWFPIYINLRTHGISLLKSQNYSAAVYPLQKMLIWKFFRMVCTTHAAAEAPDSLWTIPPERFIDLHPRLTNLTPRMIQTLGQGTTKDTMNIMNIIAKKMKSIWIQRGIRPETEGSRLQDPLVQPWTHIEQPLSYEQWSSQPTPP